MKLHLVPDAPERGLQAEATAGLSLAVESKGARSGFRTGGEQNPWSAPLISKCERPIYEVQSISAPLLPPGKTAPPPRPQTQSVGKNSDPFGPTFAHSPVEAHPFAAAARPPDLEAFLTSDVALRLCLLPSFSVQPLNEVLVSGRPGRRRPSMEKN